MLGADYPPDGGGDVARDMAMDHRTDDGDAMPDTAPRADGSREAAPDVPTGEPVGAEPSPDGASPDVAPDVVTERPDAAAERDDNVDASVEAGDVRPDRFPTDGANACETVDLPKPIVHFSFDDCADSVSVKLKDSAIDGPADGVRGPGTRCVVGRFGHALYFDGQPGAEVRVAPRPSFKIARVTVAAWVRPSSPSDTSIIGRWFLYDQFALGFDSHESTFVFSIAVPSASQYGDPFTVRMPAENNTWVHVAGVFDGTYVRIYRNGQLASELRIMDPPRDLQDTAKPLTLGYVEKDPPTTDPRFRGDMDEVRVYPVALTPTQIARVACGP